LVQEKVVRSVSRMLFSKRDTEHRDKLASTSATGAIRNMGWFVTNKVVLVVSWRDATSGIWAWSKGLCLWKT